MKHLRFSIFTLLVLTSLISVALACWPIPDGLRSFNDGRLLRNDFQWHDHAIGRVVENNILGPFAWAPSGAEQGDGSVISLVWIKFGETPGSGSSTHIQIQLPSEIHRWQRFSLRPTDGAGITSKERSWVNEKQTLMKHLDISVGYSEKFPRQHPLPQTFYGELTILGITQKCVTVKLALKELSDYGIGGEPEIYTLERFDLEIAE